jgi:hypothetical protein
MLGLGFVVSLLVAEPTRVVSEAQQPVAIVSAIDGSALTKTTKGSSTPLALYDWLLPETRVELAPGARVELIMIDGRRFILTDRAKANVLATTITTSQGSIKEAPPGPQLTLLAPIAGNPPRAAGAVRLRALSIAKLNPCQGVLTLRDETVLRFEPVRDAPGYDVDVRSSRDQPVFSRTIDNPPLAIPPGVLAGGTEYVWSVRVAGAIGAGKSEGRFRTLDDRVEAARRAVASSPDAAAQGLLGGIDFHLGLLNEAIAELTAAALRVPGDAAAEGAASRARTALADACK